MNIFIAEIAYIKGVVDCDFNFLTLVSVQCCCLSINNICKVAALKVQCKRRCRLLKFWQFNAYKKGLQRVTSRVRYVKNPDKPHPREHATKGARPCCAASEKTRGARKNLFIYE